jgi:hypothetical protein
VFSTFSRQLLGYHSAMEELRPARRSSGIYEEAYHQSAQSLASAASLRGMEDAFLTQYIFFSNGNTLRSCRRPRWIAIFRGNWGRANNWRRRRDRGRGGCFPNTVGSTTINTTAYPPTSGSSVLQEEMVHHLPDYPHSSRHRSVIHSSVPRRTSYCSIGGKKKHPGRPSCRHIGSHKWLVSYAFAHPKFPLAYKTFFSGFSCGYREMSVSLFTPTKLPIKPTHRSLTLEGYQRQLHLRNLLTFLGWKMKTLRRPLEQWC